MDKPVEFEDLLNVDDYFGVIPGLYFLFYKKEIVYIGKSVSVLTRIRNHLIEQKIKFDQFIYIKSNGLDNKSLSELETKFIKQYRPKFNKTGNPEWEIGIKERNKLKKLEKEETIKQLLSRNKKNQENF